MYSSQQTISKFTEAYLQTINTEHSRTKLQHTTVMVDVSADGKGSTVDQRKFKGSSFIVTNGNCLAQASYYLAPINLSEYFEIRSEVITEGMALVG